MLCYLFLCFGKYNPGYFGKKVKEEEVKEAVCAFCIVHYGVNIVTM